MEAKTFKNLELININMLAVYTSVTVILVKHVECTNEATIRGYCV